MRNTSQFIEKARAAIRKGDNKAATSLLNQVLQRNINDTEAWLLLYRQLGGADSFETFQQNHTKKYFPKKIRELNQSASSDQDESSLRRVSITGSKNRPSRGRAPGRDRDASKEKSSSSQKEKKPGFFARLFGGFGREKKVKQDAAAEISRVGQPPPKPREEVPPSADKKSLRLTNLKASTTPPIQTSIRDDLSIIPPAPPATLPPISSFGETPSISDEEKIRVLIVDDISQTRENLIKLLTLEPSVQTVGAARTGAEGVRLAVEREPHVILMDINMPDMDGLEATRLIRAKIPYAQVIVLTVQDDPNYMREAIIAGARDYLIKPPTIDELVSAVQRAYVIAREEKARMPPPLPPEYAQYAAASQPQEGAMKVISLFSPKGGTGCTTLASNLAVTLQSDSSQVIIVDGCMHFGGVGISFNERVKNTVLDLTPRVEELDPEVVADVAITHAASRVKILPAPEKVSEAETIVPSQLSALLKYLSRIYAYVIVDTGSYLTEHTLAVFDVSDLILVVTTQDIPALDRTRRFLDLVPALGLKKDQVKLVLNRYNDRINITPERISANFKQEFSAIIPYDPPAVIPSTNQGSPFMLDKRVRGRPIYKAIKSLAAFIEKQREAVEV